MEIREGEEAYHRRLLWQCMWCSDVPGRASTTTLGNEISYIHNRVNKICICRSAMRLTGKYFTLTVSSCNMQCPDTHCLWYTSRVICYTMDNQPKSEESPKTAMGFRYGTSHRDDIDLEYSSVEKNHQITKVWWRSFRGSSPRQDSNLCS